MSDSPGNSGVCTRALLEITSNAIQTLACPCMNRFYTSFTVFTTPGYYVDRGSSLLETPREYALKRSNDVIHAHIVPGFLFFLLQNIRVGALTLFEPHWSLLPLLLQCTEYTLVNTMSSIITTLTTGIQEVSAILPLLGTQQCEEQVGLALNNGFLYVAITPISLFGSLGIVSAAFNTLMASIAIQRFRILGATTLAYMGFHPKGDVSESISMDGHKHKFVAESQLENVLENMHVDDVEALRLEGAPGCLRWNIFMMAFTLTMSPLLAIVPYLLIIKESLEAGTSIAGFPVWTFPVIRVVCNVVCAIATQFLIQIRILNIVKMRLIFLIVDKRAKTIGCPLARYIHHWNKDISSEMCIWALQSHLRHWNMQERRGNGLNDAENAASSATTGIDIPPAEKRKELANLLQYQFTRHYPRSSPFTRFRKPIFNLLLSIALLVAIPGSVFGYIGCFNVVNQSSGAGPIIWLGLEAALCFLRTFVWALNPVWDDCGGISFCMVLLKKCPLVTCSLYSDELEKLGSAPVMREDEFLAEVSAYSGPMGSLDHKGTTLYYIFTGVNEGSEEKSLYIIVSNFKEQTSRVFIRKSQGEGFRMCVSRLVFDARSYFTSVSANFLIDTAIFQKDQREEKSALFADPKFMRAFERHYEDILNRMRPKASLDQPLEKRFKFRRGWSIGRMVEIGIHEEVAHHTSRYRVMASKLGRFTLYFWKMLTIWRSKEDKNTDSMRHEMSKLTREDIEYIRFGQKERQTRRFIEQLERWIQQYLEALNRDFQHLLHAKKVTADKSGPDKRLHLILYTYEVNEVEFLIIEARRHMEILLLQHTSVWRLYLTMEQQNMVNFVTQRFDKFWREKLGYKLSKEWQISQTHQMEYLRSNMIARLDEQFVLARTRMEEQEYDETIRNIILGKWESRLDLPQDDYPEDIILYLENEYIKHLVLLRNRFEIRRAAFFNELLGGMPKSREEERLYFWQMFQQIKDTYIGKAEMLFSMLQGQAHHFSDALRNAMSGTEGTNPMHDWNSEMTQVEKLRFVRNHRFIQISNGSLIVFGGNVRAVCKMLKYTRGITAVDFLTDSVEKSFIDEDFEEIAQTVQEIRTITGVFMPRYSEYPKISAAVKSNVEEILNKGDDACFYEHLQIADHCRAGNPYLFFNDPASTCTVKFRTQKPEDHALMLRHCFKGWWGDDGEIKMLLNGGQLNRTWGSVSTLEEFGDEDITLPHALLKQCPGELNELVIKLVGGSYHLSDVFLPAMPLSHLKVPNNSRLKLAT